MTQPTKACPVVLRRGPPACILAFEHPLAGCQLVKGGIEPDETPAAAALRELAEESGLRGAHVVADLGAWASGFEGQEWSFQLCGGLETLPDSWTHQAPDDGGHAFRFFWHPLDDPAPPQWHWVHRNALAEICLRMTARTATHTP